MKRKTIIALCLSAVLAFTLCSCSGEDKKEEQSSADASKTESSAVSQDESSSLPDGMGELLYNSFGNLWSGETYYIDTTMAVESASLSFETSDDTSKEESETEESKEESSQTEKENVIVYDYKIAVDQSRGLAMLNIQMPDGTKGHLILKDRICYKLDDEAKNYMSQSFTEDIKLFGEIYTTQLYLGMMNNIKLDSHGKADFESPYISEKEKDLDYEKYILTPNSDASDAASKAYITYYFKNGVPFAELLETDLGNTTFIFHKISDKISDDSIFKIPDDYSNSGELSYEPSEEPSEESADQDD